MDKQMNSSVLPATYQDIPFHREAIYIIIITFLILYS